MSGLGYLTPRSIVRDDYNRRQEELARERARQQEAAAAAAAAEARRRQEERDRSYIYSDSQGTSIFTPPKE
jgi:septal ring factor EnvC (AmiA/AmiB activator)